MKQVTLFIALIVLVAQAATAQSTTKLWFDEPATYFEESLVLGNGRFGASVFAGVESDRTYPNDATLWSGEPFDPNTSLGTHEFIQQIREALANENYKLADKLNRNVQGKYTDSFAPPRVLYLKFDHDSEVANCYRELDIGKANSKTSYEVGGVKDCREYFVSPFRPDCGGETYGDKKAIAAAQLLTIEVASESIIRKPKFRGVVLVPTDGSIGNK